jgi:NTP pyrophosphatase (non-canonical NTP hydrolase)
MKTPVTAIYPQAGTSSLLELMYLGNGLAGEAGEVSGKISKLYRDGDTLDKRRVIMDELGDVMWFISQLANAFGVNITWLCQKNAEKLQDRKQRDVLEGSGDKR